MKCMVTGAAGFIGSTLCEALLERGDRVTGLDCFTDYYDRTYKDGNLKKALAAPDYRLVEYDLASDDFRSELEGLDVVFHLAAQPGVRASWGDSFFHYTSNNVLATQRLMESCVATGVKRIVYASSSSVYGDSEDLPSTETSPLRPVSPYGVTKAATEHLGYLYFKNHGLKTMGLRYFTVYGPRQRPDMAFHRFIRAILENKPIHIYGDGRQSRDFTYVDDAVKATMACANSGKPGSVYNIGGGSRNDLHNVLDILGSVMDKKPIIEYYETVKGDVRHTASDCSKAQTDFGYEPSVGLQQGLEAEVSWLKTIL